MSNLSNEVTERALYDAVAKLIKAKGRFHTEQNYAALVKAFDACTPTAAIPRTSAEAVPMGYVEPQYLAELAACPIPGYYLRMYAKPFKAHRPTVPVYAAPIATHAPADSAAERDAARYRWLTAQVSREDRDGGYSGFYRLPFVDWKMARGQGSKSFYHATFDDAIDAAMQQKGA